MRILVTGGAGFIGSHTVDALVEQGHRVKILDNLQPTVHPGGRPEYINPEAEFVQGDVRNKSAWERALKGIEAVFHFAAYQDYLPDFSTFFHTNAVGTALLYEVAVEQGLDLYRIIVATSQAVMGEGRYRCPRCRGNDRYPAIRTEEQLKNGQWDHLCEDCGTALKWLPSDEKVSNPFNQYALSKHSQEQIAQRLGSRYRIPTTIMRYSIVQGPRQSVFNAYSGAMRIFALSLITGRSPTIYEDGKQIRDFVNINDVVSANLMVLDHPSAVGRIFNVGGRVAWTVKDFYEKMQEVVGKRLPPLMGGYYRYGDTRHIFSDTTALESLGWEPRHTVKESIRAYWDYISRQAKDGEILKDAEARMKRLNVIRKTG